jgi:riboflavin kinase/FMN adenylyltransferase
MGTFDGVHLGHQKLLEELRKRADKANGEAVVITYYHHPLEVIHRKTFPYLLTERFRKEELLKQNGVDCVLYLEFDEKMATLEPIKFLQKIIIDELNTKELVVGYDTHFGKFRQGNYEFLKKNASTFNYEVELIEPFKINNRIISSSLIRDFVREGDMVDVARCLGRNYSVHGTVIIGEQIGTKIGFPTINVRPADPNKLLPGIGVYICEAIIKGKTWQAVTNIGYSPTLKNVNYKVIETHVLDFSQDVYHEDVEIIFHRKIRDEIDFAGVEELVQEINRDIDKTRRYFEAK